MKDPTQGWRWLPPGVELRTWHLVLGWLCWLVVAAVVLGLVALAVSTAGTDGWVLGVIAGVAALLLLGFLRYVGAGLVGVRREARERRGR